MYFLSSRATLYLETCQQPKNNDNAHKKPLVAKEIGNSQRKTLLRLYQNKRSLAYLHRNFDTKLGCIYFAKEPYFRDFSQIENDRSEWRANSETIGVQKGNKKR